MHSERAVQKFWAKVRKQDSGCWEWAAYRNPTGYGGLNISDTHKPKCALAHRFSWEIANGPIPDGLCVLHKCDNPACVNPDHLFPGYMPRGKDHHFYQKGPKLTRERAKEIRESPAPNKVIALEYGIDPSMVSRIKSGHYWKD